MRYGSLFRDLSMFKDFGDIENKRTVYNSIGEPDYRGLMMEINRAREKAIGTKLGYVYVENSAMQSLSYQAMNALRESRGFLRQVIEIDTFYSINYTCDYFLTSMGEDYISENETKWNSNFSNNNLGCNVALNIESFDFCWKNRDKINIISNVPNWSRNAEPTGSGIRTIGIPKLCGKLFLYLTNNMKSSLLYGHDNKRSMYERYLFGTVYDKLNADVRRYNFDYSDYYVFECLTHFNYATTLSILLGEHIPTSEANNIDGLDYEPVKRMTEPYFNHYDELYYRIDTGDGYRHITEMEFFGDYNLIDKHELQVEVDKFIRNSHKSYAASIMLSYFYNEMPKSLKCYDDDKRKNKNKKDKDTLKRMLAYFQMIYSMIEDQTGRSAYQKFYKMYDEYYDRKDKMAAIRRIKEKNIEEFESKDFTFVFGDEDETHCLRGKCLIPDELIQNKAEDMFTTGRNKTDRAIEKFNAYIQKHLIIGSPTFAPVDPKYYTTSVDELDD